MDILTVKNIQLADYLQSLGYHPVKKQGNSLWYNSPLREEKEPSFKVNLDRNLWYDFGVGKGGNIIALAQELYQSNDIPYLLDRIAEQSSCIRPASFSFGQQPFQPSSTPPIEIVPLSSPALFAYLQERGINTELAKRECKELRSFRDGKPYFAIAFPNASGGYEIRNKYFKGCTAPKDITHVRQQGEPRETCFVFEGFMDYLSFQTIRQKANPSYPCLDWQDYIILNSVSNLSKALYPLGNYERIHCLLDNDDAGRKAVEVIQSEYGLRVRDSSHLYSGHKDLNDYLCGKRLAQSVDLTQPPIQSQLANNTNKQEQQPPKKKSRGFRM